MTAERGKGPAKGLGERNPGAPRPKAERVKTARGRKSSSTEWLARQLNDQLRPRLEKYLKPGARVVSHDYPVSGWKPTKVERTEGKQGHVIYVYEMPPIKDPA